MNRYLRILLFIFFATIQAIQQQEDPQGQQTTQLEDLISNHTNNDIQIYQEPQDPIQNTQEQNSQEELNINQQVDQVLDQENNEDNQDKSQSDINQLQSIFPDKSPNDNREYQAVILSNQLKALFIYSPYVTKSACAISVGVGSLYNPQRSPGLAHFLQHMLFMGSKRFPDESEYSKFIKSSSGSRNAYTNDVETNYYFQTKNTAWFEGVQRLIDFFIEPLLSPNSIEKERQAVHNQFIIRVSDDNRKKTQILRELASPPYSRFGTGNADTLGHEYIREDLINFYDSYYSSNIMNAVFYSNYSIDKMKQTVIPWLESIQNKKVELPQLSEHFTKSQTGKFVRMQSIKDKPIYQFFWAVEYLRPLYPSHVSQYISHVIGHQAKNSLLSFLKSKNYAFQLTSSVLNLKAQSLFSVQIKLTQKGEEQYQKVYDIVLDYISALQVNEYIYNQLKQRNLVNFQFKQKTKTTDYARLLATKMHFVNIQHVLNSQVIFQDFEKAALDINRVLSQFTPQNLIVVLSSKTQLQDPITQSIFGVKYQVYELPEPDEDNYQFLQIPQNPFIPVNTQFHKFQKRTLVPKKIRQNFYLLQDSAFKVSKGGIQLRIFSQQDVQFMRIYSKYLKYVLDQLTYPARLLSSTVDYDVYSDSIVITIFGFSDTVLKLLEIISDSINLQDNDIQNQIFYEVALNDLIKAYQNFFNIKQDKIADTLLQIYLTKGIKTIEQSIQEFQSYTYERLVERINNFWKRNILRWIVVGNFIQQQITQLIQKVQNKFKGVQTDLEIPTFQCLILNNDIVYEVFLQSDDIRSSCASVYYQAGPYTEDLYYKLLVLKNYIDQPFFNELRTNKQMAYSLGVRIDNTRGVLGLRFVLISSSFNPKQISDEIKTFVSSFFEKINEDLGDQDSQVFDKLKQSVFNKVKSPLSNLKSFFLATAKQINEKTYYYTRKLPDEINSYLDFIEASQLQQLWDSMKSSTLQIYIISKVHKDSYAKYQIQGEDLPQSKEMSQFYNDLLFCC